MKTTPDQRSSTAHDGERSIPRSDDMPADRALDEANQIEPSIDFTPLTDAILADLQAIQRDIEQRRERIARKLEI